MIRRALSWPGALALLILALARPAAAEVAESAARFDAAPTSGQQASTTIAARDRVLHRAMACGNEFAFARAYALASRYGNKGYTPDPDAAQWPVTLMIGKAAWLVTPVHAQDPCEGRVTGDVKADWGPLTRGDPVGDASPADIVNRVYRELFDGTANAGAAACAGVARPDPNGNGVLVDLSDACLARQIRAVMTDPQHGPWVMDDGQIKPELPGTSASKLPCLSELSFGVDAVTGDWDMGVIEYTRLTELLYRYGHGFGSIGDDVEAAVAALNRRFLTLRSSPEQGATAREGFNLVASCGNLPNQFGDAIQTVNGTGADPGADKYSDDARDALDDSSFWEDLLHFLAALLVVVLFVVAAVLVGLVVGAIAGAVAGAVAVGAAVAAAVAVVVAISLIGGSIQETENHLLMQNSSRYIKNKLMMAELSAQGERGAFNTMTDLNEELREWLLKRLKRIAEEDFVEYNAKPYNRLSHAAILNLLDYACDVSWAYDDSRFILNSDKGCDPKDRAVVDAASAVLDLSAAKDAVGSFEGRRLIPYRRLAEQNYQFQAGRSLLALNGGADAQLAALQIWTGQMRHAPNGEAARDTFNDLMWYSTSRYRPDPMILQIAINKAVPREQQYRHWTRERYASGNGWLITAGGTDERPAQGLRSPLGFTTYPPISGDVVNDRGVGVPTTLMTAALIAGPDGKPVGRARVTEFLRFEGNKKDWGLLDEKKGADGLSTGKPLWSYSDNNCVAGSFACGLALRLPSDWDETRCRTRQLSRAFFIVDSKQCPSFDDGDADPGNDLFIAIFRSPQGWGFWEVARQDEFSRSIDSFAAAIRARNGDRIAGWTTKSATDRIGYVAVTQNRLLEFTPADEDFGADRRACGIVNHESGARLTISDVPAGQAAQCRSVGPRIFIDLNDAMNPIRRGEGGLALESFVR